MSHDDAQAWSWIRSVVTHAAIRLDEADRKRTTKELLLLDIPSESNEPDLSKEGARTWKQLQDLDAVDVQAAALNALAVKDLTRCLTPRQMALCRLLYQGYGLTLAARRLGIPLRTASRERRRIALKMREMGWRSC